MAKDSLHSSFTSPFATPSLSESTPGARNADPSISAKMANLSTPFTTPFGNGISSKPDVGEVHVKVTEDIPVKPADFRGPFGDAMCGKK